MASDGKKYLTDCADTEGLLRIIQSVPSAKAEPFKRWLAVIGKERLDEIEQPAKAIERAKNYYIAVRNKTAKPERSNIWKIIERLAIVVTLIGGIIYLSDRFLVNGKDELPQNLIDTTTQLKLLPEPTPPKIDSSKIDTVKRPKN